MALTITGDGVELGGVNVIQASTYKTAMTKVADLTYSTDVTYAYDVWLLGETHPDTSGNAVVYINSDSYMNPVFHDFYCPAGTRIRGRGTNNGVYNVQIFKLLSTQ